LIIVGICIEVMKKCIIFCPQGLGDWVMVNPIVRILSKKYERVALIYNSYSAEFLPNMFKDLENVQLEYNCQSGLPDINVTGPYYKERGYDCIDLISCLGKYVEHKFVIDTKNLNQPYNRAMYSSAGFDWNRDTKEYYIPIDDDESERFHKSLNLPEEYIFLHEGIHPKIDRSHIINKNLPIFEPHYVQNVFLYKHTIENAKEIHVVASGIYNFADKLNFKTNDFFMHGTRTPLLDSPYLNPILNKPWKMINY